MADGPKAPLLTSDGFKQNYGMQNPGASDEKEAAQFGSLPGLQTSDQLMDVTSALGTSQDNKTEAAQSTSPENAANFHPSKVKKKQPGFLHREILITNPKDVDKSVLLKVLHDRFTNGFEKWKNRAKVFKMANLTITVMVILIQVTQVIIFQIPSISQDVKTILATVLPALTGAMLGIQLKLAWSEKGAKCKQSARLFKSLTHHTDYRMKMAESGGEANDIDLVKLWNTALLAETKDVPAFLLAY